MKRPAVCAVVLVPACVVDRCLLARRSVQRVLENCSMICTINTATHTISHQLLANHHLVNAIARAASSLSLLLLLGHKLADHVAHVGRLRALGAEERDRDARPALAVRLDVVQRDAVRVVVVVVGVEEAQRARLEPRLPPRAAAPAAREAKRA